MPLILSFLGVLFSFMGDVFLKKNLFTLGLFSYAAASIPAYYLYKISSWFEVAVLWTVMAIILSILVGLFYFKEPLTIQKFLAFSLVIIALLLINK